MTQTVLEVCNLVKRYNGFTAVDNLSFEVYEEEIFGLLGHNGAGKTTTVRLLNGLLIPNGGTARVLGLDPVRDGPALRRRTGVLTETPSLDERLTARENLTLYVELYGVPDAQVARRVGELLTTFELAGRANELVGGYSKGMKQRLALARALLHEPEVLFLDEPTAGLDPVAARRVHQLITRLSHKEGRTVFLCTHNLAEAQELCDRVAVLEHGRLLALGTLAELARRLVRSLRLEIEVAPEGVLVALGVLRAAPSITNLAHREGLITVQGADRRQVPELVTALAEAGVRIYRVMLQEPSLGDVYFALHGEGEA